MKEDFLRDVEATYDVLFGIFGLQLLLIDGSSDKLAISKAKTVIQQKKQEIEQEKQRIERIRTMDTHRKELERARREKEARAEGED